MKKTKKQKALALITLVLVSFLLLSQVALAEGMLGMRSPDNIMRGQSFKVTITAPGASAGVAAVQMTLIYDSSTFQFVKANSLFMGRPGSEIVYSEADMTAFLLEDDGGSIRMIAGGIPHAPGDNVIADLEFVAKVDANIGPVSFIFDPASFITVVGSDSKITATTEKLTLKVDDLVETPISDTPVQPAPLPAETTSPSIDVPYDPNNQLAPVEEVVNDTDYGIGNLNAAASETTAKQTSAPSKPTVPSPKRTEKEEDESGQSPLRSVTGEALYVPEGGLAIRDIPEGFRGGTKQMEGVYVPTASSNTSDLVLFYLSANGKASFYTYEENIDRFKPYSMDQLKDKAEETSQSRFGVQRGGNDGWKILLVSLLGLSSLSVFVFTTVRNVRG